MKIAGIIAEYNPFHNGHKYLIDRAKEETGEKIVCAMSGNFVQRGEYAFADSSPWMKMVEQNFVFDPYAEGSRKPTYKKQLVVGSTTLAVTEDKVKISFMVPRHLAKPLMLMYIQSEIDEVKRRLQTDVYDMLAASPNPLPKRGFAGIADNSGLSGISRIKK